MKDASEPVVIVYQVRAISARGQIRIVHAFDTKENAELAIQTMKAQTGMRYTVVPVPNQPDQYWGINF